MSVTEKKENKTDDVFNIRPSSLSVISDNAYGRDCENCVLIIVTGGTFIMSPTKNGLQPQKGYLEKRMKMDIDFSHSSLPEWVIMEWEKPIDSSCIDINHWITLTKQIHENYDKYRGFIILHGTDTMAYTASALSFMLENLAKPVVITGAQIPIGEVFNDAKNNLIASLCVAGQIDICEVCLMFNNKLFRGNRSSKIDAWHQGAFSSPNFPPLGLFGIDLEMEERLFLSAPKKRFKIWTKLFNNIITVWLHPGFNCNLIKPLFEINNKNDKNKNNIDIALVLAFYGAGIGIESDKLWKYLIDIQNNKNINIEIILMQQTQKGNVDIKMSKNKNFIKLKNVINAQDMTSEAVVTKLAYLMGKGLRGEMLKKQFEECIRGEMTPLGSNHEIIKIKGSHNTGSLFF